MTRSPARVLLLASALSAGTLLTTASCANEGILHQVTTAPSPSAVRTPAAHASPAAAPVLTPAQAQAALITDADLGAPWTPTQGTATWRDGLLKAQTAVPDCQRLLDALYADELLGTPAASQAVTALDDTDDEAQLRYQVAAFPPADVDRTLTWLKTLPQTCASFTATTTRSGPQTVTVTEATLPNVGDTREGLRLTFTGTTPEGDRSVLTLDTAAVRIGDDTITLTNGGLANVPPAATGQALEVGAQRLTEVQRQGRVQI
ncbi:hypothetical protein OG223_27810 [Streptomyces sp. NBC_01478]|jgi:hypothetical protein|uniref:hypothetical protein n=1 Tax=Streptomyces sp. NBC_01478 TaxID=2903882 RepID=UPI002E2F6BEB|nr:hypothetical protein [Streptomyces sp. NBC_01478]